MELIYSLIGFPQETEWLEFKESNSDCIQIGRDISALSNAAAYCGREYAYKIWGVDDASHRLVGTTFNHNSAKGKGNQLLPIWLKTKLSSNARYEFIEIDHQGRHFCVLKIAAPTSQPVYFDKHAYIREGTSTTEIIPGSAKEAELWKRLQNIDYELHVALEDVQLSDMPDLLDIDSFFNLMKLQVPTSLHAAAAFLTEQCLIKEQDNGRYSITNLGALLIARDLRRFLHLEQRAIRVVAYVGNSNLDIRNDTTFTKGYALSLPEAQQHIAAITSTGETNEGAFRLRTFAFPPTAVRELLSNAVIHQDLSAADSGPLVRIYSNRIVFSNPGSSLIPAERILNAPPRTRNNKLAGILRQMHLCEEAGTGWDRAVKACEDAHMLSPHISSDEDTGTTATLFDETCTYDRMTRQERMDAVYWHACLMYAQGESLTNQSLRHRFGLPDDRKSLLAISRLISNCCTAGTIKVLDKTAGPKDRSYIPHWA
ncbi:MAG: ATP-binding protein [Atopobiaceae bacterium]